MKYMCCVRIYIQTSWSFRFICAYNQRNKFGLKYWTGQQTVSWSGYRVGLGYKVYMVSN